MFLIHPSGGLRYHWRAHLYRKTLWAPFCKSVEDFLESWDCKKEHLILIGPSAAYTLPTHWLASFNKITCFDLDIMAPFFFKLRHGQFQSIKIRPIWKTTDFIYNPSNLNLLSELDPQATILFSNVLGQRLFLGPDYPDWMSQFNIWIGNNPNRQWASYHDVFSSTQPPIVPPRSSPPSLHVTAANLQSTQEELINLFWPPNTFSSTDTVDTILQDHGTWGMTPQLPRIYSLWQLLPQRWHLIEMVKSPG